MAIVHHRVRTDVRCGNFVNATAMLMDHIGVSKRKFVDLHVTHLPYEVSART